MCEIAAVTGHMKRNGHSICSEWRQGECQSSH